MEPLRSQTSVPAIEMRQVAVASMRDQSLTMIEEINWRVEPKDFWVVAGLQGSGKTDFLLTTAGVLAPRSGDYWLFGEPMPIFDEPRLPQRLRLGLAFETGQLLNHLTVAENIALPLRYHHNLNQAEAFRQVSPLIEAMELAAWADSTPGAIGRNWQKRVGLARALVLKPELLLLDGPLTGLDLRHMNWWLGFLGALSQRA